MGNSRRHSRSSFVKSRLRRLKIRHHARREIRCHAGLARASTSGPLPLLRLQLRVAREEPAALQLVATRLEGFFFSHTRLKVAPVVLFRDLNSHVLAVVFHHGEDKRSRGYLLAHNFLALLYPPSELR